MNDNVKVLYIGLLLGAMVGFCIGLARGKSVTIKRNNELLSKLGIQIIETRVFNGEPVYSYRIIENKTKEESK